MIKSFKYRLYPNKEQTEKLQWVLRRCCDLYNTALQERKWAYVYEKKTVTYYDQSAQMTELKGAFPEYKDIPITVLREPLQRVDKAMKAFFRRVKAGETPGYPRFKGKNRYDSFTYVQSGGFSLTHDNRVCLSKIGSIKVKLHRPIEGKMKTCTVKREGEQWYVIFACEIDHIAAVSKELDRSQGDNMTLTPGEIDRDALPFSDSHLSTVSKLETVDRLQHHFTIASNVIEEPPEGCSDDFNVKVKMIGIDLGVTHFAALSNGKFIENPRYYRKGEKTLERRQQALARKKKGSHRREKAKRLVARAHRKVRNQRKDFLHKASRELVGRFQVIVFEDLQTANLVKRPKPKQDEATGQYVPNGASAKAGLNKSIHDAGWDQFVQYCTYKAEYAGREVLTVRPNYTSQICPNCGVVKKKSLDERWHSCECGCSLDRDHAAAINILKLGQSLQARKGLMTLVASPSQTGT